MKKYVPSGLQIITIKTKTGISVTDFTVTEDMKVLKEWLDKAIKGEMMKPLLLTVIDETNNNRVLSGISSYYVDIVSKIITVNLMNLMEDSTLIALQLSYNGTTQTLSINYISALA